MAVIELGIYYATGHLSNIITIAIKAGTIMAWWVLMGSIMHDNSICVWLFTNVFLLLLLEPWLMHTSRVLWLSWFFHKDDELHTINIRK